MDNYEAFEVRVIKLAGKAALLEFLEFDDERVWIPYSQIEDHGEDLEEGEELTVYLTDWIARQKRLI